MNIRSLCLCLAGWILVAVGSPSVWAAANPPVPPSFRDTVSPVGWTITKGAAADGNVLAAKDGKPLALKTDAPVDLPVEVTVHFRTAVGDAMVIQAGDEEKASKPLLECTFTLRGANQAAIVARASGEPMATTAISTRGWNDMVKKSGSVMYQWRFPQVRNVWDDSDRSEIGTAYGQLVPFAQKTFAARLVLTATTRQIWMDDRLVAEEPVTTSGRVHVSLQLSKTTQVLSAEFGTPADDGAFHPLRLADYRHARDAQTAASRGELLKRTGAGAPAVPVILPASAKVDLDLGQTLYRYRLTIGHGPDAPYVNAMRAWPGAFAIDPATVSFRVPYRAYQNVWLLAWVDRDANAVPRGTLQFFREDAGYPAQTDFEITDAAIKNGTVTKLAQRTADGKPLYLVRVPVDTDGLYGFRDLSEQFLDFQLSKPAVLNRSYPDPIYYGYHPAGLPSSIHVVGITLEEAPFGYEVNPKNYGFVFEQPEKPAYTVTVTNTTSRPLEAKVALQSRSYDGAEQTTVTGTAKLAPGQAGDVALRFDLKKLGWHELKARVEAGGVTRSNTLSMVLLPANTRTYGSAANEMRFGTWDLWGHYIPFRPGDPANERILALFRKLGLRRIGVHGAFVNPAMVKKYDFLAKGPHTVINVVYRWKDDDADGKKKMVDAELAAVGEMAKDFAEPTYFYGGEWHIGQAIHYAPWPFYTGDGDRELTKEERDNTEQQIRIFTTIGKALRARYPQAKLFLQWGSPQGTMAFLRAGIPKEIVDGFGMDAPMFELLPEISNVTGSINQLWMLREEAKRFGWSRLPIHWCEGPFFPTTPGALTETDQMDYQVRYLLLGLGYGIDQFEAGIVPHDAGNYYGAEHYGAGIFHRIPLENPKPAVAAVATMTAMLCGADPVGGVDTGCLTTYCLEFQRAKDQAKIFALWRVNGTVAAKIKVHGSEATVTDAMGNATKLAVQDGTIQLSLSSSPVWLTGVTAIEGFDFAPPVYDSAPAKVTRPLVDMTADKWTYRSEEDKPYSHNHFAIRRITDPNLKAEFGTGESGRDDAVSITLPVEPGDRPLATRYGTLVLKKPVAIPGKAAALGLWIKGNSSWGRVVYQLRDAKGEIWTSVGTKDDWNSDDTHAWSYVNFEGWRYVRFPLPGSAPYDAARDLETTWWGSHGGDGIVDLPLTLEKIFVEARNEVPYLSVMKPVPDRSYKLSHLVAEYGAEEDAAPAAIARNKVRMPVTEWVGPTENPMAKLAAEGTGPAPAIREFGEPTHFNDGRRMTIQFAQTEGAKYNLYLGRYADGRGAELLKAGVKDGDLVAGFRPEMKVYLFLTSVGADKKESKPSAPFELVTHDHFAEK